MGNRDIRNTNKERRLEGHLKRKHKNILWIDNGVDGVYCAHINLVDEKSHCKRFKKVSDFLKYLRAICLTYQIDTILLDCGTYGIYILDRIDSDGILNNLDVDIVPYTPSVMRI